jgi:hypothetical protein
MLYLARAKQIPPPVKPFVSAEWIKSESANRAICAVMGWCTLLSGIVFTIAGLIGRHIFPL